MQADVKKGVDPAKVEAADRGGIGEIPQRRPDQDEIERVPHDRAHAGFIRGVEKPPAKRASSPKVRSIATIPPRTRKISPCIDAATPASVLEAAQKWMSKGDYTLTVKPAEGADPTKDEAEAEGLRPRRRRAEFGDAGKARLQNGEEPRSIAARAFRKSHRSPISHSRLCSAAS